ncbi:hypothetical protein [Spirosoma radiotolerans]|uniref:N-acetylglucosamine-6-phosphate deacetylase n=1 Tax=Spirosoma radiotolerans TaxID=1379870 RepID=A0A0E3V7I1_9BACT|nr:hypothetical protein [Spirosoma radiotolerans]AKD55446.1 hypothetical protein SD10_11565 [Spirosoma radiotolerans]
MMLHKLVNGTLLTPYRAIQGGTIVIGDGQVLGVHEGPVDVPDAVEIDAKGQFVAPCFIDIHVHGGGGFDFRKMALLNYLIEQRLRVALPP